MNDLFTNHLLVLNMQNESSVYQSLYISHTNLSYSFRKLGIHSAQVDALVVFFFFFCHFESSSFSFY